MVDGIEPAARANCVIVGVGASAGGLDAFGQLLHHIPPRTRLAFVLIQHLDAKHPSTLADALTRSTELPVQQAVQDLRVEAGHVYVITPNTDLAIAHGRLVVSPRKSDGTKPHLPVDFFLRSLAAERHNHAIGVVLSGSASDGTHGLRAIQEHGGISFAQDPRSAKFPGMPQSAVDAGVVDHCLDIPELARALIALSEHSYLQSRELPHDTAELTARTEILARVRQTTGTDFDEFKPASVTRRLLRRVALRGAANLQAYLRLLDAEPQEVIALREEVLIHVTAFFRDPEVFEALRDVVFPEIVAHKPAGGTIRVWIAGCSTGEEVYSLAIALLEFLRETAALHPIQIFGSDISEVAIQKARLGIYGDAALSGVSQERRDRYFVRHEHGQRIDKSVRDRCVFVPHDLARDPPFSKLDLLSCRNVLIYFDQALQKRVLPTLHYCLSQPGFLILGRSENIAGFSQLFSDVDKAHKIFKRSASASSVRFEPRTAAAVEVPSQTERARVRERGVLPPDHSAMLAKHLDRLLLARYCPAGVLVKANLDVVLFRGQTGSYLQAAPGQPQHSLIGMARGGLLGPLRESITRAQRELVVVRTTDIDVDQNGSLKRCDLVVIPFSGFPGYAEELFVVLFEEPGARVAGNTPVLTDPAASALARRNAQLEHELAATKEYLHLLVEEHGRTNDELGTSNEELISGNEELQSMNEELETAKEELQSANEELTSLNDELQHANAEMIHVNADLLDFSLTVDIPILRLDMERRVQRITPAASSILQVSQLDIGRRIDDITLDIAVPDLIEQIKAVMDKPVLKESEVQTRDGHWYRMQIRPYEGSETKIQGALVSFVDIDELKRLVADADRARAQAELANSAKDSFLAVLSHELRTPLASMLLNAQRLRDVELERSSVTRVSDAMEHAIKLQVKLIDDLLDISRIVVGKLSLDYRVLDFSELVRKTVERMSALFDAKQLALELTVTSQPALIWADAARVEQVVINLVGNAIKFTPRFGKITVTVDVGEGGQRRLRVTDTGIGIEASFLPHVFAHFAQSDSSITRSYGGQGLGLAIVHHLVALQGGSVRAESAGLDRGATFTVTLPAARSTDTALPMLEGVTPHVQPSERADATQQVYAGLKDVRVLFIDDDFSTREAVVEVLALTGACVASASSAADGLVAVQSFKPQVVVCDIAMPGEDGYSFIRKLRAGEPAGQARVATLALTALASSEDRDRALEAGFQRYLSKPIDIDRLRAAVLELAQSAARPAS